MLTYPSLCKTYLKSNDLILQSCIWFIMFGRIYLRIMYYTIYGILIIKGEPEGSIFPFCLEAEDLWKGSM